MDKKEVLNASEQDVLTMLQTSRSGLSQKEATKRLKVSGLNRLPTQRHQALRVFGRQLRSSLVYLLIAACVISIRLGGYSDSIMIGAILIINTVLAFYQEYKSERIVEKLSKFITKNVAVKRDNSVMLVDESTIVPGDLVVIREGDIVPADLRLLDVDHLQMNESSLTGESTPVTKQVINHDAGLQVPGDRSLAFMGSIVEKGEGIGVVYATGSNTEFGAIAALSSHTKKQTQYEKSLQSFSASLMKVVLGGLGLVFALKLLVVGTSTNAAELFVFLVALAVTVVPEALPVIATVVMTSGAMKLAKEHVVVKRLSSLEDFGNVTLLCTDKTGTITENKMAITKIVSEDEVLMLTLAYANVEAVRGKKRLWLDSYSDAFSHYIPTEIKTRAKQFTILKELPFDPELRRRRTVVVDGRTHKHYLVAMGSPETLLDIASTKKKREYKRAISTEGAQGLRHFGIAYKTVEYTDTFDILTNETGLQFLGYVTLLDPLRPSAKHAIEEAEKLGVAIKILTGDSKEVAEYTGRTIGLLTGGDRVYTGEDLEKMTPDQFRSTVATSSVFARVSPRQKYDIVKALKETNVVAYQGDGINDAPSLKLADVAIAVDSATDIAKESADIVLLKKNLEVIVSGIKYGRVIFVNINKYIKYTMVGNFGNFIALGALYLLTTDLPLLPIQLLLTSLLTDFPLISIATDHVEEVDVVRPEKHVPKELVWISIVLGIPTALFELAYFSIIHHYGQPLLGTALFIFLTFLQLVVFFSIRTTTHVWQSKGTAPLLTIAFLSAFMLSVVMTYVRPFQTWFRFVPLPVSQSLMILCMMIAYLFVIDAAKVWYQHFFVKGD